MEDFWSFIPSEDRFVGHWRHNPPTEIQRKMLARHYWSPDPDMPPTFMAEYFGWRGDSAHLHYGRFAGETATRMGVTMPRSDNVALFCEITGHHGDTRWRLHDAVRSAIEILGYHEEYPPDELLPNVEAQLIAEGHQMQRLIAVRGRSMSVRDHCLAHHEAICVGCGFDPGRSFGPQFVGLIEVHHVRPIADGTEVRITDPVRDCRPLCPTCHRLVHCGLPHGVCRSIDELKMLIGDAD